MKMELKKIYQIALQNPNVSLKELYVCREEQILFDSWANSNHSAIYIYIYIISRLIFSGFYSFHLGKS